MRSKAAYLVIAFLPLSACGPAPTDPGPGGVTMEDAEALDEAAEKLDTELAEPPLVPGEEQDRRKF
ncbi:MAG: hypothetical protein ACRCY3_09410 [Sphingorhabdus sp.]